MFLCILLDSLQYTATHRHTLQHAATHCNTLQHTTTFQSQDGANCFCVFLIWYNTLQCTATHCQTPQHTATHCNILKHKNIHQSQDGANCFCLFGIDVMLDQNLHPWLLELNGVYNMHVHIEMVWMYTCIFRITCIYACLYICI